MVSSNHKLWLGQKTLFCPARIYVNTTSAGTHQVDVAVARSAGRCVLHKMVLCIQLYTTLGTSCVFGGEEGCWASRRNLGFPIFVLILSPVVKTRGFYGLQSC